jgi:hypothetical protein
MTAASDSRGRVSGSRWLRRARMDSRSPSGTSNLPGASAARHEALGYLVEEEGVPPRALFEGGKEVGRGRDVDTLGEELGHLGASQAGERDPLASPDDPAQDIAHRRIEARPPAPGRWRRTARRCPRDAAQEVEQQQRRAVGRMKVVEDEHQGPMECRLADEGGRRVEQVETGLVGRRLGARFAADGKQAGQIGAGERRFVGVGG